ncbi:MAG: RagB/SusD family nutrient uptake outer membrane protein [Alistipes senegalensis]
MKFKLEVDGARMGGFDPRARFQWSDPNSPEIVFSSFDYTGSDIENLFYPNGFQGSGAIGITKELVDAFPMANGYPIDDPASGYDENDPYAGRDPRFYATVFYHGAEVVRPTNSEVMYTFDVWTRGGTWPMHLIIRRRIITSANSSTWGGTAPTFPC